MEYCSTRSSHTLRASDNHATVRRDVNAGDRLVVAFELILEIKTLAAGASVEQYIVVSGHCEGIAVGREGMIRNGCMEEVMRFWSGGHGEKVRGAIGGALYYCWRLCYEFGIGRGDRKT